MVGHKCENLHGHNWNVEVRVAGDRLNTAGVLVDFGDIKRFVKQTMDELDHKFLNEIEAFAHRQPTSERIAVYIAENIQKQLEFLEEDLRVSSVTAWESEDACATYFP